MIDLHNRIVATDAVGMEHIGVCFIIRNNPTTITTYVELPEEFVWPVISIRKLIPLTKH